MKKHGALLVAIVMAIGLLAGCVMPAAPLTWDYVGSMAQEKMPQINEVFFWRKVENVGYAVVDMAWVQGDDSFSQGITWVMVNGRECGLERVVLVTTTFYSGANYTTGFIHAYGEGLANWPVDAVTDAALKEYLGPGPVGAVAYSLPYNYWMAIDPEVEEGFAYVVELDQFVLGL